MKSLSYLILSFAIGLVLLSCQKEHDFPSTKNDGITVYDLDKLNLNSDNRELLRRFSVGELQTSKLEVRDPSINRSLLPTKFGESLEFNSDEHVVAFLDALAVLQEEWNYSDDHDGGIDLESEKLGNSALNAVDRLLGHNSVRASYGKLTYENADFKNILRDKYIDDPDLIILLDNTNRLVVGDKAYKFIPENKVIISTKSTYNQLENINAYNTNSLRGSTLIYNWKKHIIVTPPPHGPPPFGDGVICAFAVESGIDFNGTDHVIVRPQAYDNGPFLEDPLFGQAVSCSVENYEIHWGDGTISGPSDAAEFTHTYDMNHLTSLVPDGQCKNLKISVKAYLPHGQACGNCTGSQFAEEDVIFEFCNNATCQTGGGDEQEDEFNEDGLDFRVQGEIGQRIESAFLGFLEPMIWTKARYAEFINGRYRGRKPPRGMRLHAEVAGGHFSENCDLPQSFAAENDARSRNVTARATTGRSNFTTKDNDPTEPIGAVRIESEEGTYSVENIELHPN